MIEQDTQNGYGFYCDMETDYDNSFQNEIEKNKHYAITPEKYPISFFLNMMFEHPERYLFICITSCLSTCLFCYWYDRTDVYAKNI